MSTQAETLRLADSFAASRVLLSAVELGVIHQLRDRAWDPVALAKRVRCHAGALQRLLEALCALGLARRRGRKFTLVPRAATALNDLAISALQHRVQTWVAWSTLTASIRTGRPVASAFCDPHRQRQAVEAYMAAMQQQARLLSASVTGRLGLRSHERVLDVGCGPGEFAAAMVHRCRGLRVTALDLPDILPISRRNLRAAGLAHAIETVACDYHESIPKGPFDLVFLSQIVHGNMSAQARALLRRVACVLGPGGRVAILDFLMDEPRTRPLEGALFGLTMLVTSDGGNVVTTGELKQWLGEAGLRARQPISVGGGQSLLIARRARRRA
jgi:cyclopropane fatty-acyl-phospholipid synthase-like methyltransferase